MGYNYFETYVVSSETVGLCFGNQLALGLLDFNISLDNFNGRLWMDQKWIKNGGLCFARYSADSVSTAISFANETR